MSNIPERLFDRGSGLKSIIKQLIILSLFPACMLCGCKQPPLLNGFDSNAWISDHDGCSNIRGSQVRQIIASKDRLMGKAEDRILDTFGTPDRNELYDRNQKFYIYYLDPGPSCQPPDPDPDMLIIRFSAIGLCNEVFTQHGFSTR